MRSASLRIRRVTQRISRCDYRQVESQRLQVGLRQRQGYPFHHAGTVLRLYSCLSGQLISQYHMSGQLSTLLDLCFTPEGTAIACLNLANELNLFHTNMSELELIS